MCNGRSGQRRPRMSSPVTAADPAATPSPAALRDVLERYWGYTTFRPLQQAAMEATLAGRDTLVVMPTGAGKSICFQAPALVGDGVALVVSPLISLMKDQVDTLVGNGVAAACYNSALSSDRKAEVMAGVRDGRFRLLYVSPERLVGEGADVFLGRVASGGAPVRFVAIDEAHCISQWGHDFRPEYRQLGRLRELFPGVSLHAFTATATARVRRDIAAQLGAAGSARAGRVVQSTQPDLPGGAAQRPQEADPRRRVAPPRRGRHRLLPVAQGGRSAGRLAQGRGPARGAVPCRALGRGAAPSPGRVPRRARRRRRGHGGLRHGHRSLGRALRAARRGAAVGRALPAGVGPRRPRRPRGRVRAGGVGGRLPQVAADARTQRRAHRPAPHAAARHGALRRRRGLPASPSGPLLRRDLRQGRVRRLRLLPRRARGGGRTGDRRPPGAVVRGPRRAALRRRPRHQRAARHRHRERHRARPRHPDHVRAAARRVDRRGARLHRPAAGARPAAPDRRPVSRCSR